MMQGDAKLFKMLKNKAVKGSIMLEASLSELQFQHMGGNAQTHILCYVTDLSGRARNTQVCKNWQKSGHEKNMPTCTVTLEGNRLPPSI